MTIKTRKLSASESYQRIIEAATQLFAEHGYHGVSMRDIAAVVDLNIATISYHIGSKQELYREVHQRAYLTEEAALRPYLEDVPDEVIRDRRSFRDLLLRLTNAHIELGLAHPEIPRLHVRRWLAQHDDALPNYHDEFSLPIYQALKTLLDRAHAAGTIDITGLDVSLFLQSFSWIHHGYLVGMPARLSPEDPLPHSPESLERLRGYLRFVICRSLQLPMD
ncbi:MAG: TetR/AcrR family transcriptional regulator [Anaerolineae bacterium]